MFRACGHGDVVTARHCATNKDNTDVIVETPATESPVPNRTAVASTPGRHRQESGRSHANFVVGGVVTMVLCGAFALALPMLGSREVGPLPPQTTSPNWDVVGTIMFPPSGAFCRQLSLDNTTGAISQAGFVRCIDLQLGRERTSASAIDPADGPLESLRRSFTVGR